MKKLVRKMNKRRGHTNKIRRARERHDIRGWGPGF